MKEIKTANKNKLFFKSAKIMNESKNKNQFFFKSITFFAIGIFIILFCSLIPIANAELTLTTDKNQYFQGEIVVLSANIGENTNITFQVKSPDNKTIFTYTKETKNGKAEISFKLRDNAKIGNYTVFATANVNGETYKKETTFSVKEKTKEELQINVIYILIIAFVIGTAVIIIAYVIRELAKYSLLQFLLPLWPLLSRKKVEDSGTRMQILGFIKGRPGTHLNEIINVLNIGSGNAVYHLYELEKEQLIEAKTDGLKKRFYPRDIVIKDLKTSLSEIQKKIIDIVKKNALKGKGIFIGDIARELKNSEQVVKYHIDLLYHHGILIKESNKYYLSDKTI